MHEILGMITTYIIPFVFVLGLLIVVHELGHFSFAKMLGIRVERFSIGFPPRLFGKKVGDTDYCISALPIGGYVKMSGMIDESLDKDGIKGEPWEFMSKPAWAKMLVIFAGPLFNFLLAMVIFMVSVYVTGIAVQVEPSRPVVGSIVPDFPAQKAGLLVDDVITTIQGQDIETWKDLVTIIHQSAGQEVFIEWQRNGEYMSGTLVPEHDPLNDVGLIGVGPQTTIRQPGVFEAMGLGAKMTWDLTAMIGESFGLLFTGKVPFKESIGGPIQIAKMTGDQASNGFDSLMWFAALLSINLGLLNLLPLPVLDGGHLVFITVEAIMRKPLSLKIKIAIQQVGMALLLALMVFVIFNDVAKLIP